MCVTENSKHSVITAVNGPPAKLARRDTETSTSVTPAGALLGAVRAKRFRRKKMGHYGKSPYRRSGSEPPECLGRSNEPRLQPPDTIVLFWVFFFEWQATPTLRPPRMIVSFTYLLFKSLGDGDISALNSIVTSSMNSSTGML